jgi:DNA-binding Lrp family transcriptional regulator
MEKAGIIRGATIHINYKAFGYKAFAYLLISVDPLQEEQFIEYAQEIEDVYSAFKSGPKGNIRLLIALKTFQQLDEIKEALRQRFSVLSTKTVIWTDVKEMHENLRISADEKAGLCEGLNKKIKLQKLKTPQNEKIKIDEIDLKIADILSENGRAPLSKIAHKLGISTDTVKRRYKRLRQNGVLKVTIQMDPTKIGYNAMAIFFATYTARGDSFSIIEKISQIPDIISIMKTTGDYDLQIYALIKDIDKLLLIQDELSKVPGLSKVDLDISGLLTKWPTPRQYISTF